MNYIKLTIFILGIIIYPTLLDKITQDYIIYFQNSIGLNGLILLINVVFFTIIYFLALFGRKELKSPISVKINSIIPILYALIVGLNMFFLLIKSSNGYENPIILNYIYILTIMCLLFYEYVMKYSKPEQFSADGWVLPTYGEDKTKDDSNSGEEEKEEDDFEEDDFEKDDINEEEEEDDFEKDDINEEEEEEEGWKGSLMFSKRIFVEDILIKKFYK